MVLPCQPVRDALACSHCQNLWWNLLRGTDLPGSYWALGVASMRFEGDWSLRILPRSRVAHSFLISLLPGLAPHVALKVPPSPAEGELTHLNHRVPAASLAIESWALSSPNCKGKVNKCVPASNLQEKPTKKLPPPRANQTARLRCCAIKAN